ncbi:hypothetical protein L208DRAFT_1264379 [Tricholoma matsutake]|nr:hypothetical protein L208DRAFT_1264379 [Tricholoma matsutake 945]
MSSHLDGAQFQHLTSQNNVYSLQGSLRGHQGAVLCLCVMDGGKVASGGELLESLTGEGQRGAATALVWIRQEDKPEDGLVYGTQNRFLICWKQTECLPNKAFEEVCCMLLANLGEVTALAFDAVSNRLAVCHRNAVVQIFAMDLVMMLCVIFSVMINNYLLKAIAFGWAGGKAKDIMTFGLHVDKCKFYVMCMYLCLLTLILKATFCEEEMVHQKWVFCIDDPTQEVALYQLNTFPITRSIRPQQVSFSEDCRAIVSGSDHGIVYVFNRRSGEVVDKLRMDPDDWVQTIMASLAFFLTTSG